MITPNTSDNYANVQWPQKDPKWQYWCSAMEHVLSLGDIQKDPADAYAPEEFCALALTRINDIIHFDASAIYVVEPDTSDLILSATNPAEKNKYVDSEMDFLVNQGTIAWAIREKRGICVYSRDGSRQLLLHVIATYARIRGIFIGVLPQSTANRPDGANEFLSLLLRSAATSLESIEYVSLLNQKNALLCKEIDDKVEQILHKERQIAFNRKLNAIASLAGGIAHEFNNALTALTGYNDLTKINYHDAQDVLKYANNSSSLLDRLTSLTQQLLSYSRGGKYKTETVSVKALIDRCLHHFKSKLENGIGISVNFQQADILINCDVTQINEVLRAVITNAIEAIEEKGKIDIAVMRTGSEGIPESDHSSLKPGMYVAMEIKDNGCGMDQNTKDRIFEPFFSTKFVGRGLSMAAVRGIVENHHGAIFVNSVPERKTIVRIYLPLE
jgi:signal transduction histidine kinase